VILKNHKFLTIGSPDSRRVRFWGDALRRKNQEQGILSYEQVINEDFPKITSPTVLRITSPGEDFELKKQILKLGGYPNAEDLVFRKGLIIPNSNWYKGWKILLHKINGFVEQNALVKVLNIPDSIHLAFHKLKCQQLLNQKGIRTPRIFINKITDYDSLVETLQNEKLHQIFIKPYHGSSASGVMAFRQAAGKQVLYTTIDLKPNGLFNHLRLQRYTDVKKIKTIVNSMIPAGLMAEEWIYKKTFQTKSVDFRILVIEGKASFTVPRMSNGVITNLHLGNEKGNIAELEEIWGKQIIQAAEVLAEKAVEAIGGLFYAGVDVAISNKGIPYILEVNAFGDMLLNIYKENLNTYEYELMKLESEYILDRKKP